MNIFLDANVLVSILNKEYPVFSDAAQILSLADNPRYRIFTSPMCISIAWYFAAKKSGNTLAKKKIALLCEKLHITSHQGIDVVKACNTPGINDVEDGMEYFSALNAGCACIITADTKDFYFSSVPVFHCRGFLQEYFSRKP